MNFMIILNEVEDFLILQGNTQALDILNKAYAKESALYEEFVMQDLAKQEKELIGKFEEEQMENIERELAMYDELMENEENQTHWYTGQPVLPKTSKWLDVENGTSEYALVSRNLDGTVEFESFHTT